MAGISAIIPVLAVAAGGSLGAVARYGVGQVLPTAPLATLLVNVAGCGVMGIFFGLSLAGTINMGEAARGFLLVGFLGALTTFSAFSLDTFRLIEEGRAGWAFLYIAASVVLSLAAFFIASTLTRALIAGE